MEVTPRPCARKGCKGTARRNAPVYITHCSAKCASGWRKPNGIGRSTQPAKVEAQATESWWLNTNTFYDEARKRFPLQPHGLLHRGWGSVAGNR